MTLLPNIHFYVGTFTSDVLSFVFKHVNKYQIMNKQMERQIRRMATVRDGEGWGESLAPGCPECRHVLILIEYS